jgi:hypothetical protein
MPDLFHPTHPATGPKFGKEKPPSLAAVRRDLAAVGLTISHDGLGVYRLAYKQTGDIGRTEAKQTARNVRSLSDALTIGLDMAPRRESDWNISVCAKDWPAPAVAEIKEFAAMRERFGLPSDTAKADLLAWISKGKFPHFQKIVAENIWPTRVVSRAVVEFVKADAATIVCQRANNEGAAFERMTPNAAPHEEGPNIISVGMGPDGYLIARDTAMPPLEVSLRGDGSLESQENARALADEFDKARAFADDNAPYGCLSDVRPREAWSAHFAVAQARLLRAGQEGFAALDAERIEREAIENDADILTAFAAA